jgi:alpha-methylacyl-CoA racemase
VHNQERGTFIKVSGVTQPAPAPRFSRSHPQTPKAPGPAGGDTDGVLRAVGYGDAEIKRLRERGALT